MATVPVLALTGVFGVKGSLRDGVVFVDATTVVYIAGHCVVVRDVGLSHMQSKKAKDRFITGAADMAGISSLAISKNKKWMAVAEVAPATKFQEGIAAAGAITSFPVVTVYSMRRLTKKGSLTSDKAGSREYVSMSFTWDGKHIAALGGAPDWQLQLWHINDAKVVCAIKTATLTSSAVYQVRCCPVNEHIITVVGDGFAKTFKVLDNTIRQVSKPFTNQEGHRVLCHAWLQEGLKEPKDKDKDKGKGKSKDKVKDKAKDKDKDKADQEREPGTETHDCGIVYALDSGELFFVENGEVIETIWMYTQGSEKRMAHSMISYSQGFICGENGSISIYERGRHTYKKVRSIKVDESCSPVCGLDLSPEEDVLVCVVSTNRFIHLPFRNVDVMSAEVVSEEVLTESYHQAAITGMDICLLKPFVVTCSSDSSLRIWNYMENLCEIVKFFPSEASSISIHPTGLYVLVGFPESLQLFSALVDDLRLWKEFTTLKGCLDCAFSCGGQYFAAAYLNSVHIISTYTGQIVAQLRAHLSKVRSIWWAHDDYNIITAGMDGAIYEWTLKNFKRSREHVIKGCMYTCVIGVPNSTCFLSTSTDRKLREMDELEVFKTIDSNVSLSHIALSLGAGLLFAGTEHGAIRAYQYPLTGVFHEVKICAAAIVKLCVSNSGSHLFCTSEDGLMMMFDLRTVAGTLRDKSSAFPWSHEVLITKSDVQEYRFKVKELKRKVKETKKDCDYQVRYKDEQMHGRIKDLEQHYERLLEEAQTKYETLKMHKLETELQLDRKQIQTEKIHAQRLRDMEDAYCTKMLVETARYNNVVRSKEADSANWAQRVETMTKAHELALLELMEAYETKLEDTQEEVQKLTKAKEELKIDFEEIRKQVEEDADFEIQQTKAGYEKKLEEAKDALRQVTGENGLLQRKFLEFQRLADASHGDLQEVVNDRKELYDIIQTCQLDLRTLKHDIKVREGIIDEKDLRIHDLKRSNEELEKLKYVLDYKVKDLLQNIEPTEQEARQCKERMQKMEAELFSQHDKLLHKDMTLKSLKAKLSALGKERVRLVRANSNQTGLMSRFQLDYYELAQQIEDPRALKKNVIEMYAKYVGNEVKVTDINVPLKEESFHQRDILERKVKSLEHVLEREIEMHKQNRLRMIRENTFLINEVKDLREQNEFLAAPLRKGTAKKVAVAELRDHGSLNKASSTIRADPLKGATSRHQLPELQLGTLEDRMEPQDIGPSSTSSMRPTTSLRPSTASFMRPSTTSLRPSSSVIRPSTLSGRQVLKQRLSCKK